MTRKPHKPQLTSPNGGFLTPWEMVAHRMSLLLGKPVTAQQCRGLHAVAIRKLRRVLGGAR
jgi:hypothetical protein